MPPDLFMQLNGVRVRLQKLPGNIRAFSMPFHDGYLVIINDSLSIQARRAALIHELEHIAKNDHFNHDYLEYEE